jgi:hypothetical protein
MSRLAIWLGVVCLYLGEVVLIAAGSEALRTTRSAKPPPPPPIWPAALPKLKLSQHNAIDVFGTRIGGGGANASEALLDEQELAGDPASGHAGNPRWAYFPGWTKWEYPELSNRQGAAALVDLQAVHAVSDIWLHHGEGGWGAFNLELFEGNIFSRVSPTWRAHVNTSQGTGRSLPPLCSLSANSWCGFNISSSAAAAPHGRYLLITLLQPSPIFELVLYGQATGPAPPPPPPSPPLEAPLMGEFIGMNSFTVNPLARQVAAGSIREYHDWPWDEGAGDPGYPHALTKFSPDYSGFDSDDFYNRTAAAGIKTHVVLQGRPPVQTGMNASQSSWKCVDNPAYMGTNKTTDPASYTQLAAHLYQYAARYGAAHVPDTNLALAPGQKRFSGANILAGIEVSNSRASNCMVASLTSTLGN